MRLADFVAALRAELSMAARAGLADDPAVPELRLAAAEVSFSYSLVRADPAEGLMVQVLAGDLKDLPPQSLHALKLTFQDEDLLGAAAAAAAAEPPAGGSEPGE